ncbi:MAG: hypothetical protein MJY66_08665 [Bacteroidaceae bacterium]|nr:hypothetical protein [Bacteroidaceae bacterium]
MVMDSRESRLSSLLDSFIEEHRDEIAANQSDAAVTDYVAAYLEKMPSLPDTSSDIAIRSRTESLLDAFFQGGAQFRIQPSDIPAQDSDDMEERESPSSDSCYTETLARVYLKQHRYDKALEIIRALYLNFPNKSIYFADQIRYLEKLVVINQKQQ